MTRVRRTQRERREDTIRRLIDAATETLIERGYAEASLQRICERAGLTQGALFRHFPTREALMVAVGEDVGRKLLSESRRKFTRAAIPRAVSAPAPEAIATAIRIVRDACRTQLNQAWYELAIAARTSDTLRSALRPFAVKYNRDIAALARELLPDLAALLGERFDLLVDTIVATFDGEVVHRFVLKRAGLDEQRLELLSGLTAMLVTTTEASA
jgi:AcrR family transcriptional regulator